MKLKELYKLGKKGLGLGDVPGVFLSLVLIVTIGVAAYLVLAGLQTGTTNVGALGAIGNFTISLNNIVAYAPTWGTIIGVAILIGIVVGAFYFGKTKFGGGE